VILGAAPGPGYIANGMLATVRFLRVAPSMEGSKPLSPSLRPHRPMPAHPSMAFWMANPSMACSIGAQINGTAIEFVLGGPATWAAWSCRA